MPKFKPGDRVVSRKTYDRFGIRAGDCGTVVSGILPPKDGIVSVVFTKTEKDLLGFPVTRKTNVRIAEDDLYLLIKGPELLIGSTVAAEADIDLPHENVGDPLDAVMVLLDKLYPGRILSGSKKDPEEVQDVPGFILVRCDDGDDMYLSVGHIVKVYESGEIAGGTEIETDYTTVSTTESVGRVMKKIAEASR